MRVLFVTDSRAPNVALMKFSAWAGIRGHVAGFDVPDPTHILVSCIWQKNRDRLLDGHRWFHPHAEVIAGGPGYDPSRTMPKEIERMKPDYSLYPKYHDSIGFVTQGCIRKCPFCVVPAQGPIRYVQHVSKFYQGGICRILDDNILAMPDAFRETAKWLIENKIKTHFEYLDIRLITEENAGLLIDVKHRRRDYKNDIVSDQIHFAYDITNKKTEELIKDNVELFGSLGIKPRRLKFLVYIHSKRNKDLLDAAHRWDFLRCLGVEPFGMCNVDNIKDKGLRRRVTWTTAWKNLTTEEVFGITNEKSVAVDHARHTIQTCGVPS